MTGGGPYGSSRVLLHRMSRRFRNMTTAWLWRGNCRGALRDHDDLHFGLHLEDVALRQQSLVLAARDDRLPEVAHWDPPLPPNGAPRLKSGPADLSGQYLMNHGLTLPWSFPDRMWGIEGQRL